MPIHLNKFIVLAIALLASAAMARAADDAVLAKIRFPISQLGGCTSRETCKTYCDKPENIKACTEFAQQHNLLPKEEIERNNKIISILKTGGPGGCRTEKSCRTYCADPEHVKECTSVAQRQSTPTPTTTPKRENIEVLQRTTPTETRIPSKEQPSLEGSKIPFPSELMRGAGTNLPPAPLRVERHSILQRSTLLGSLLRLIFSF